MENCNNDTPRPLLDMAPLCSPGSKDLLRFGKEIVQCFEDFGFVYLKNIGIPWEEIEEFVKAADKFFELDYETQIKYYRDVHTLHGFSTESTELANFHISLTERSSRYMYDIQGLDEPFPDEVPELKETAKPIIEKVVPIVQTILKAIELGLDYETGFLVGKHNNLLGLESSSELKIIKYLPPANNDQNIRFEPHCDFSTITLQLYGDLEGLQLMDNKGNWQTAKLYSGYALLFPSEELQLLTGNRIKAVKHQVLNPSDNRDLGKLRHAVLFFVNADHDADLRPYNHSNDCPKITGKEYSLMKSKQYFKRGPLQ